MQLTLICLLMALAIVQALELYRRDALLDRYREMGDSIMFALNGIADGELTVVRIDKKTVKVVPLD